MNKDYELDDVCKRFLDSAYMLVDVTKSTEIKFNFDVCWLVDNKYWRVIFICNNFISIETDTQDLLGIIRDSSHNIYTKVEKDILKEKYEIVLEWTVNYKIECKNFSWNIHELHEKEYNNLYFNE